MHGHRTAGRTAARGGRQAPGPTGLNGDGVRPVQVFSTARTVCLVTPPSWTVPLAGLEGYMALRREIVPLDPAAFGVGNTIHLPPADMSA